MVFAAWKLVAEEVKHPNVSYLPAMVSTLLNKRIPYHDDILLTKWYGHDSGRERWRVLSHRLDQATASLLMFDVLDIVGRAGEAARLSGVEFHQSFPGIRGSQYKVEGVLLRALRSIQSDERGSKRGFRSTKGTTGPSIANTSSCNSKSSGKFSSDSETQSPWKVRRGLNDGATTNNRANPVDGGDAIDGTKSGSTVNQETATAKATAVEGPVHEVLSEF